MYKSKLQELCHRYSFNLPEYKVVREGPSHDSRFIATVVVNGLEFHSPRDECRSSKDAQNLAARYAFEYFSANPPTQNLAASPATATAPDLSFLPPQLQHSPRETLSCTSGQPASPQPVQPLLEQTQTHNASSPAVNSTDATTSNIVGGQSTGSDAQTPEIAQLFFEQAANTRGLHKSRLFELCQKHSWAKPEFTAVKEGPDHNPRFGAAVIVNGVPFTTPNNQCRSSKEATNFAAFVALYYLSNSNLAVPQQHYVPSIASSFSGDTKSENADQKNGKSALTSELSSMPLAIREMNKSSDVQYMYKNQLQQFAQKQGIPFPEYSCEIEGPPHARRFRAKVAFYGRTFECLEFFSTMKEAEQAAAKAALEALSPEDIQKGGGLYKTLLQQLATKLGYLLPVYKTVQSGPPHAPSFVSTVEFGNQTFQGQEAKSKKQSELSAAEAAYTSCHMMCTEAVGSKRQRTSRTSTTMQPSPDNKSCAKPFERELCNSGVERSIDFDVKETDKIMVSVRNSNDAQVSCAQASPSSSAALTLEHLSSSVEESDRKRPATTHGLLSMFN